MTMLDIEIQLKGTSISEGIAIGSLHVLDEVEPTDLPKFSISERQVDHEIQRYRKAINSSREDLFRMQDSLAKEGSVEAVTIIDSHIQMLQDPFMTTMMEERIRDRMTNTEAVFSGAMGEYEAQFEKINDAFFQQRLTDVKDLSSRILKHLSPGTKRAFSELRNDTILFSRELALSDTAEAPKDRIMAFLSQLGSQTSHAALIARAKGIPYVSSIDVGMLLSHRNAMVIVDGSQGLVIIRPSEQTLEKYHRMKKEYEEKMFHISTNVSGQSKTRDGVDVNVFANIESVEDVALVEKYKADGIGLFRSEYLFFDNVVNDFSEESQYKIYRNLVRQCRGMPLYFRVFDVGADKQFYHEGPEEANPALGCRSIRFLLRHRDIFRVQLRALLRAASNANVHLLLPLITDVCELKEVKRFIRLIADDLEATGYRAARNLKIGSMIEVPSAVITCDAIAAECDFLSIGTNDLIQYTLAVDRVNPAIADIYQPSHPAIVRMLNLVVQNAGSTPVSLCGEMASNPLFTALLLGLGLNQLSCSPRYIPLVKHTVCSINMKEAQELAQKALSLSTSHEVHQLLSDSYCTLG